MRSVLLAISLFFALTKLSHGARSWEKVQIYGASCGHGDPYFIYLSKRSSDHFGMVFQGGGACWDALTCSTNITTKLKVTNKVEKYGVHREDSPLADATIVYFPYCTGDMFAGNHNAIYPPLKILYHHGRRNVYKAMDQLIESNKVHPSDAKLISLYGASAGALGLAMNLLEINNRYLNSTQTKIVTLDGVGLHWKPGIFHRFSNMMTDDIDYGFRTLGVPFDKDEGHLAEYVPLVCHNFPEFEVGILQGSMDWVMSIIFGLMSPLSHRRNVYGKMGVYQQTKNPHDNCQAWVPDTFTHTFLDGSSKKAAYRKTKDGMSALNFMHSLYQKRRFKPNYR